MKVQDPVKVDGRPGRLLHFANYQKGSVPTAAWVQFDKQAGLFPLNRIEPYLEPPKYENGNFPNTEGGQEIAPSASCQDAA